MNYNSPPAFLYISDLFKTIEYKLDSNNILSVNELSVFGYSNKKIILDTETIKPVKTRKHPTSLNILLLILSYLIVISAFLAYLDITHQSVNPISFSIVSLILVTLLHIYNRNMETIEIYDYIDPFTNNYLFSIKSNYYNKVAIEDFIIQLNESIKNSEQENVRENSTREKLITLESNSYYEYFDNLEETNGNVIYKRNYINETDTDSRPKAEVIYIFPSKE